MGKPVFTVEFTEDELEAIERALKHANANDRDMRVLLKVFYTHEIARASRIAWNKTGKALREITIGTKPQVPEWLTESANSD